MESWCCHHTSLIAAIRVECQPECLPDCGGEAESPCGCYRHRAPVAERTLPAGPEPGGRPKLVSGRGRAGSSRWALAPPVAGGCRRRSGGRNGHHAPRSAPARRRSRSGHPLSRGRGKAPPGRRVRGSAGQRVSGVALRSTHQNDRHLAGADHFRGGRAEDQAPDSAVAIGAHHQQIDLRLLDQPAERGLRLAGGHAVRRRRSPPPSAGRRRPPAPCGSTGSRPRRRPPRSPARRRAGCGRHGRPPSSPRRRRHRRSPPCRSAGRRARRPRPACARRARSVRGWSRDAPWRNPPPRRACRSGSGRRPLPARPRSRPDRRFRRRAVTSVTPSRPRIACASSRIARPCCAASLARCASRLPVPPAARCARQARIAPDRSAGPASSRRAITCSRSTAAPVRRLTQAAWSHTLSA